jgi:hypothetical protein
MITHQKILMHLLYSSNFDHLKIDFGEGEAHQQHEHVKSCDLNENWFRLRLLLAS